MRKHRLQEGFSPLYGNLLFDEGETLKIHWRKEFFLGFPVFQFFENNMVANNNESDSDMLARPFNKQRIIIIIKQYISIHCSGLNGMVPFGTACSP